MISNNYGLAVRLSYDYDLDNERATDIPHVPLPLDPTFLYSFHASLNLQC